MTTPLQPKQFGAVPEQLPLFMTPREIMGRYQPFDGDRKEDLHGYESAEDYAEGGLIETDEQVWDRKLNESMRWKKSGGGDKAGLYDQTLHQSVRADGVEHPVWLSENPGSSGKPQVAGGHHRIAAAHHIAPDGLVPVLHAKTVGDAMRSKEGYGYR